MNSKIIYFFAILVLGICSCKNVYNKEYKNPLNIIESIKTGNSYNSIILTMEKYYAKDNEILVSFIYKKRKASIKLNFEISKGKLEFINIGKESDYFLYAVSELFEEEILNSKMNDIVVFSIERKGEKNKIDLFDKANEYTLSYQPNLNEKGNVQMRMTMDMELGEIRLWGKNGGIAKKNLVKAFYKPE